MRENEPITAQIQAPIPSKKNNRVVLKNGVNIPSKEFRLWYRRHIGQFKDIQRKHKTFSCPVSVSLGISFGDRRRRDLDNALTSVMDLIKDSGLIIDDDWVHVTRESCEVLDTREHYAIVTIAPCNIKNASEHKNEHNK